jgi:hypothetical protein
MSNDATSTPSPVIPKSFQTLGTRSSSMFQETFFPFVLKGSRGVGSSTSATLPASPCAATGPAG